MSLGVRFRLVAWRKRTVSKPPDPVVQWRRSSRPVLAESGPAALTSVRCKGGTQSHSGRCERAGNEGLAVRDEQVVGSTGNMEDFIYIGTKYVAGV